MKDHDNLYEFYDTVIGLPFTWKTVAVMTDELKKEIVVKVAYAGKLQCPKCKSEGKVHDHRIRRLRYLDNGKYKTYVEVNVPRIKCPEHGVQQLPLDFAEKNSMFTTAFEMQVIEWLGDMTIKSVGEKMGVSWDAIDGIMQRAVQRGLERRQEVLPVDIGIDETSFKKGHDYVTVIIDKATGNVLEVLEDKDAETVTKWFKEQTIADFSTVRSISMDMSGSFIKAMADIFEDAKKLICFDRFHVSQLFNKALDKVRRAEYVELSGVQTKNNPLKESRFGWLINSERTDNRSGKRKSFLQLARMHLKTSRAWRIKETASTLWEYEYLGAAEKNWKSLLWWIAHCRIDEMKKVGRTIKEHLWGILNAVKMKTNNAILESKNSIIQYIKRMACGFRNKDRFRTAILFHLGGLNMAI